MKKAALLLISGLLIFVSCKKNQLGGKSSISGKVMHHAKIIPNASVFIKFNAKEFPGSDTTKYDSKVRADAEGKFSFDCYKGDYYVYGFGYDYAIPAPHHVMGGTAVHLRNKQKEEIILAVTED